MTFFHLIEQEKLVVYLVSEDENRELEEADRKELTQLQKFEKDSLLLNYKKIGGEFPPFNIKCTRENM
jgi:fructoselysine-6-P-deglycase FrlB-like protein